MSDDSRLLVNGKFSTIFTKNDWGRFVAIKRMKSLVKIQPLPSNFVNSNIVQYISTDIIKPYMIKMLYIEEKQSVLENMNNYTDEIKIRIVNGVLNGLCFLHEKTNLPHNGIRAENILLSRNKAIIVGFSQFGQTNLHNTPTHHAPEIYMNTIDSNILSDVWSVGILICELWSMCMFKDDITYIQVIYALTNGQAPKYVDVQHCPLYDILSECLKCNIRERFTCQRLLQYMRTIR